MAAYTTIDNPELYFQTKLYSGDGSTDVSHTFDGSEDMQPDMVWFKRLNGSANHFLYDSVRGANRSLVPNDTDVEATSGEQTTFLSSFDSDGFTLGDDSNNVNGSGQSYVLWAWKAGTSFTNDASATSVGSIDSAGSINTTAGFSIIEWSGSEANATIAHGLQAVPKMIICKDTSDTYNWGTYHQAIGNTKYLYLNTTAGEGTSSSAWNDTTPTSTVFSVGNAGATNASGTDNMIAYCFSDVQGFSKFGSYTGNGNADSTFVYTGFRPAWVMIKRTTSTVYNWMIFDNKRNTFNVIDDRLRANTADAEQTGSSTHILDFVSNGFKIRSSNSAIGGGGDPYIYMAFAEAPFVNSNGVPGNAR